MKKVWFFVLLLLVVGMGFFVFFTKNEEWNVKDEEVKIEAEVVARDILAEKVVTVVAEKKVSYLFEWMGGPWDVQDVQSKVGEGTAFFIWDKGLLLTCKHVVDDQEAKYFVQMSWFESPVVNIWYHDSLDLAFLKVGDEDLAGDLLSGAISWAQEDLSLGDVLYIIGNIEGNYPRSVTAGLLSKKDVDFSLGWRDYEHVYMTDALVSHGSSGSPVFNKDWELQGIVVAQNSQGLGFFLPISNQKILEFYESLFVH